MLKPGDQNPHGQTVVGISDTPEAELSALTVREDCRGYCIVRTRNGMPDLVIQKPEWLCAKAESRHQLYEKICSHLRKWVLSFNEESSVGWRRNVGYLANEHRTQTPADFESCALEDADAAIFGYGDEKMGLFVREIRSGI